MSLMRQRRAALVFWALLLVLVMIITGGTTGPLLGLPLLVPIALEYFAYQRVSRFGAAAHSRWLSAASFLSGFAAVMLVTPILIDHAFGDRVFSCIFECGHYYDDGDATNLAGPFVLMYLAGLVAALGGLVSWAVSLTRMRRAKLVGAQVNPT